MEVFGVYDLPITLMEHGMPEKNISILTLEIQYIYIYYFQLYIVLFFALFMVFLVFFNNSHHKNLLMVMRDDKMII